MTDFLGEPDAFDPALAGWAIFPDAGFIDWVGPLWTRRDGDAAAFGFRAEPKHANLIGVVQGGMLMTFGDRALGVAAWEAAQNRACVTIQFDMQFISSTGIGEFVEVRPELVRRTRSLVFLRGMLTAASRVVATANGVWKILGQSGAVEEDARDGAKAGSHGRS